MTERERGITCPASGCGVLASSVGELVAHLVTDDGVAAGRALWWAREAAGVAYVPVTTDAPLAAPVVLEVPTVRRRAHSPRVSQASPATCRVCARFAPEKCYRHGGPSRSTAFRGSGGTAIGAAKTAAKRVGVTLEEYERNVAAGRKWCYRCRVWHTEASRSRRRKSSLKTSRACREAKNAHERTMYAARP